MNFSIRMCLKVIKKWLVLLISLFFVAHFVYTSILTVNEPYALNQVEGLSIYLAQEAKSGNSLYPDINNAPFTLNNYPPLHPIISSFFLSLPLTKVQSLRLFNILTELAISLVFLGITVLITKDKSLSLIFTCLLLGLLSVHKFHGVIRVDALGLFFALTGIFYLLKYLKSNSVLDLIYFSFLYTLALLAKQTNLILITGVVVYSFAKFRYANVEKYKNLFLACMLSLFSFFLISIAIDQVTDGRYFLYIFYYQSFAGTFFREGAKLISELFIFYCPVFILLGLIYLEELHELRESFRKELSARLLQRKKGMLAGLRDIRLFVKNKLNKNEDDVFAGQYNFLIALTSLSFFWFGSSIFKAGADLNYSLEPLVLTCIILCAWFSYRKAIKINEWVLKKEYLLLSLVVLTMIAVGLRRYYYKDFLQENRQKERELIGRLIKESNGLVLMEDPFIPLVYDKKFLVNDMFALSFLVRNGKTDANNLFEYIENQDLEFIMLGEIMNQMPEIRNVIETHYDVYYQTAFDVVHSPWTIYVPKNTI